MSIEKLKNDIKNKSIENLYLFYGEEEYLKKFYLNSIENIILDENMKSMNSISLEGKIDFQKIKDNIETFPVFSDRKLITIKNSGLFKSGGKDTNKGNGDDLPSYMEQIPSYSCVIFYESEIDKRSKMYKVLNKFGTVVEFGYQKPDELVKWVVKVIKSYGKSIDYDAASQLVDSCEQGMNDILNEINKAVLYVGDNSAVTKKDIENSCIKSIKIKIFDLMDAVSEKNTTKALKLLDEMICAREPVPKITFMINRQIRLLLQIKLLKDDGMGMNEISSKIGVASFAANKISNQAKYFTVEKLKNTLNESLKFDLEIKTGKIKDRVALELLIADLAK